MKCVKESVHFFLLNVAYCGGENRYKVSRKKEHFILVNYSPKNLMNMEHISCYNHQVFFSLAGRFGIWLMKVFESNIYKNIVN